VKYAELQADNWRALSEEVESMPCKFPMCTHLSDGKRIRGHWTYMLTGLVAIYYTLFRYPYRLVSIYQILSIGCLC
jgi:hypothetical protein